MPAAAKSASSANARSIASRSITARLTWSTKDVPNGREERYRAFHRKLYLNPCEA